MEASKRADFVKQLHLKTKAEIEKKTKYYAEKANKKRKKVLFQPGDLVWIHYRKDRFPENGKELGMPSSSSPS